MYIKDLETGKVRRYGTKPHDSLVISDDGRTLSYYNLQNGDGSKSGGYVFCDEEGKTPAEIDVHVEHGVEIYFNRGGKVATALRKQEAQPVIVEAGFTPSCPCCESAAWMTNADEEPNSYCGLCGQRLDWAHPEHPDAEEAEEEK